jgi:hypothetical protein
MSDESNIFSLRKNIYDFLEKVSENSVEKDLSIWLQDPFTAEKTTISKQLQAHSLYSLLDGAIFILIQRHNNINTRTCDYNSIVDERTPNKVKDLWHKLSKTYPENEIKKYYSDDFFDLNFYRKSISWIESNIISEFYQSTHHYFKDDKKINDIPSIEVIELSNRYFSEITEISEISEPPTKRKIQLSKFDNAYSGVFTRSSALKHLIRHKSPSKIITEDQYFTLLNHTTSISSLLTLDEIYYLRDLAEKNSHTDYLSSVLIHDASPTTKNSFALNKSLQLLLSEYYNGDVIMFASQIKEKFPHVAEHLYGTCTESFLSLLFDLMEKPAEAYEIRANFHDWYSEHFNAPFAAERARSLRLNQKLHQIRGEIDDARIYVDPIRFSSWLEDEHLEELSGALRQSNISDEDISNFSTFSPIATNIPAVEQLAAVLQSAFLHFCTNKQYGINSYLGRRIRHGTLSGQMETNIDNIIGKFKENNTTAWPMVCEQVNKWNNIYKQHISFWINESLQINSNKKPKGMITPNITDDHKILSTRQCLRSIINTYRQHRNLSVVAHIIYECCWILVERDLSKIREHISHSHTQWGTLSIENSIDRPHYQESRIAPEFCRKLNSTSEENFKTTRRWFTKPTNLLPSAKVSLLMQAVLEEVKNQFIDYKPNFSKHGEDDYDIIGATYHHLYDFLYVVIHNAAKHGKRKGNLSQTIRIQESDPVEISITIKSEIKDTDKPSDIYKIISHYANNSNDDALIEEGKSGIRKIFKMKEDISQFTSLHYSIEKRHLSFIGTFHVFTGS